MFCRLTYSCIQFIQRMIPPLSINYKTKPKWLSLLYKKSGQMSTRNKSNNQLLLLNNQVQYTF